MVLPKPGRGQAQGRGEPAFTFWSRDPAGPPGKGKPLVEMRLVGNAALHFPLTYDHFSKQFFMGLRSTRKT